MAMTIGMDVRGLADVHKALQRLRGGEQDRAMQMAINKTADKGRAEVNRAILDKYSIKPTEVRNSVNVRRAHKRQAVALATIHIFGSPSRRGRSMNMIRFLSALANQAKVRGSKAKRADIKALAGQLGFHITRAGGIKQIPGAFLANQGRTVFQRVSQARIPIKPVQVIGVSQMFNSRAIRERVLAKISSEFRVELDRAVAALIERRWR